MSEAFIITIASILSGLIAIVICHYSTKNDTEDVNREIEVMKDLDEMTKLKKILKKNNRYKGFTLLECPVRFKDMQADNNIDIVQLHSISLTDECDFYGFCGACRWKDNVLIPLDGDCYSDEMLVYGYEWFESKEGRGLDILVKEW